MRPDEGRHERQREVHLVIGEAEAVQRGQFQVVLAELPGPEGRALDRDVGQPRMLPVERSVGVGDRTDPVCKPRSARR